MKAVIYNGPYDVKVKDVPDAKIVRPTDVLVRITTTNICGSDLHMYEGRTSFEQGRILGHENLGEVVEIGSGVERVKVGDYVCLPFNVGCGFCENCEKGLTGFSSPPIPVLRARPMVLLKWAPGRVVRRNCFGSPLQTLTAWCFRLTQ